MRPETDLGRLIMKLISLSSPSFRNTKSRSNLLVAFIAIEKPTSLVEFAFDVNEMPQNHSPLRPFLTTSSTKSSSASIRARTLHCDSEGLPREEMNISRGTRRFVVRRTSSTKCAVRCVRKVWKVAISPFSSTLDAIVLPLGTSRLSIQQNN